jgi:hypothetical protein
MEHIKIHCGNILTQRKLRIPKYPTIPVNQWSFALEKYVTYDTLKGTCEYDNQPSRSIKCGEFLGYLKTDLTSQEGLCSME